MDDYPEVPKYRKKKSSSSKSKRKSDHKHEYLDCLLIDNENHPHKAQYCKICGKINNVKFFESKKTEDGYYTMLSYEEVRQRYKGLPEFLVNDVWDKYISIDTSTN